MYRILLPKVALLLNIAITFAGGQQSFYSNNGQAGGGSNGQYNVNPSQASGYPGNNNYGSNPPSVNPYGANNNYGYNSGQPQVGYVQAGQAIPQNHQVQGSYSNQAPVLAGYSGNSGQQMNYGYAGAPAGGPVNPVGGNVGYGGGYAAPQPTVPTPGVYAGQQQQQPAPTAYSNQNGMPQQQQAFQPQQGQGVYAGTTMMNPQSAQGNNHGFTHRILPFGGPVSYGNGPSLAGPSTTMASSSFNGGPSALPAGLSPQQLLNRRGPFDSMINRAKEWMPSLAGKKSRVKQYFNIGAHDSHRVPKPPKYPLYDMPSAGMATPPPAPLMSPMSAMPSNMYAYSVPPSGGSSPLPGGGQPHRGGRPSQPPPSAGGPRRNKPKGAGKRRRNRPAPPPPPPPPQPKYRGGNKRQRHRGKPKHPKPSLTNPRNSYSNTQISDGYDHPMASNTVPVNSPPLGRPLGYDEYMKKPSHSFTDDPWNFDPNAQSYNEGMNTHAMKYNYDPLGMNTLDMTVQTHLDANKMSYPGDVMQLDSMNQAPKPLSSQLGGWDLPPQSYRTQHRVGSTSSRFDDQHSEGSAFAYDDIAPTTTTTARNSFNQYDGGATEASIVKSETSSPLSLFSSPDGGATIEFDLDALKGGGSGGSNYNDNYKSGNSGSNYNDNYKSGSGSNYDNYKSGNSGSNYDNYKSGNSGSNYDNYKSGSSGSGYDNYKSGNRDTDNYDSYKSGSSSGSWGGGDSYNRDRSGDRHDHSDHRDDSRDRYPDETPSTSDFSRGTKSRNSNYDHYDPYSGPGSDYSGYGSRQIRADGDKKLVHRSNNNNDHVKHVETVSSSSAVSEGIGLFHDFIKDPNPGSGKAKARQSLYKALLS